MGPWFVRIESQPFRPGCDYATLMHLIDRGTVRADTAVRGPTTKQFWMLARWCPGVAHRLGICHSCQAKVDPESRECTSCGAEFGRFEDRQALGLGDVRPLPGRAVPSEVRPAGSGQDALVGRMASREAFAPVDDAEGAPPVAGAGVSDDIGDEGIRELRLRRDLRRSRRWTAVWSCLTLVTLAGLGGYVVFQHLDLGSGPVGRWLAARDTTSASEQVGGDSDPGLGGLSAGAEEGDGLSEAPDPAGDVPEVALEPLPGTETSGPADAAGPGEEPGEAAGPRVQALSRLRGLR